MAARSTFTRTSGSVITSAWANSLRDHIVPYTTTNDVTTEGMVSVNTATDRVMIHDGGSAIRFGHYTSAGRTICLASFAVSTGSGVTFQIPATPSLDADGFYTGWNGSLYLFTVPADLGGLYAITARATAGAPVATSLQLACLFSTGEVFNEQVQTPNSHVHVSGILPLAAGNTFSFSGTYVHSASVAYNGSIYITRLAA